MKTYIKPATRTFALSMEQHLMNTSVNSTAGKGSSDLVDGKPYDPATMTIGARRQNNVWGPEDEEEEER